MENEVGGQLRDDLVGEKGGFALDGAPGAASGRGRAVPDRGPVPSHQTGGFRGNESNAQLRLVNGAVYLRQMKQKGVKSSARLCGAPIVSQRPLLGIKLSAYGVSLKIIEWARSFLMYLSFRVRVVFPKDRASSVSTFRQRSARFAANCALR